MALPTNISHRLTADIDALPAEPGPRFKNITLCPPASPLEDDSPKPSDYTPTTPMERRQSGIFAQPQPATTRAPFTMDDDKAIHEPDSEFQALLDSSASPKLFAPDSAVVPLGPSPVHWNTSSASPVAVAGAGRVAVPVLHAHASPLSHTGANSPALITRFTPTPPSPQISPASTPPLDSPRETETGNPTPTRHRPQVVAVSATTAVPSLSQWLNQQSQHETPGPEPLTPRTRMACTCPNKVNPYHECTQYCLRFLPVNTPRSGFGLLGQAQQHAQAQQMKNLKETQLSKGTGKVQDRPAPDEDEESELGCEEVESRPREYVPPNLSPSTSLGHSESPLPEGSRSPPPPGYLSSEAHHSAPPSPSAHMSHSFGIPSSTPVFARSLPGTPGLTPVSLFQVPAHHTGPRATSPPTPTHSTTTLVAHGEAAVVTEMDDQRVSPVPPPYPGAFSHHPQDPVSSSMGRVSPTFGTHVPPAAPPPVTPVRLIRPEEESQRPCFATPFLMDAGINTPAGLSTPSTDLRHLSVHNFSATLSSASKTGLVRPHAQGGGSLPATPQRPSAVRSVTSPPGTGMMSSPAAARLYGASPQASPVRTTGPASSPPFSTNVPSACIGCGRTTLTLEPRQSGFKCRDCIGTPHRKGAVRRPAKPEKQ